MEQINEMTKLKLPNGFTARPLTLDEVEEFTAMANAAGKEMIGFADVTIEEMRVDLQEPGFDIEKDTMTVFSPEGKIVAHQDVWANHKVPVHPFIWGRVHPDYKNLGLGTYLLDWAIKHSHHVLDKVPQDARVSVRMSNVSTWEPATRLFENMGMKIIRHFFEMKIDMTETPPKPVWPEGIIVRPYNHPEEAEQVCRADEETFRDHFGVVEQPFEYAFEQFKHSHFKDEGFDPALWFLAMDGDEIAGFSLCRKFGWEDKSHGRVRVLGVRRKWRRRGIALALLHHSFGGYWQRDQKIVTLGVDATSLTGAVRLYEKAGMHVHQRFDAYELELRPGRELATMEVEE